MLDLGWTSALTLSVKWALRVSIACWKCKWIYQLSKVVCHLEISQNHAHVGQESLIRHINPSWIYIFTWYSYIQDELIVNICVCMCVHTYQNSEWCIVWSLFM
jgi:hypothetical protein